MLLNCWGARFSLGGRRVAHRPRAENLPLQLRITCPHVRRGHKENEREEIVRGQPIVQSY